LLGGRGDQEDGQGGGDEGEKKGEGKATPPQDPPTETITSQKRKVSPKKPSTRKKTRASKPELEATLTEDDISLVHRAMEDALEKILQRYGVKQEELHGKIKKELKEVQQAIRLVRAIPTMPSSRQNTKFGDEIAQLRRPADETEARLQKIQEEKEKATEALKQEKDEALK
jgi:hypothetical protein